MFDKKKELIKCECGTTRISGIGKCPVCSPVKEEPTKYVMNIKSHCVACEKSFKNTLKTYKQSGNYCNECLIKINKILEYKKRKGIAEKEIIKLKELEQDLKDMGLDAKEECRKSGDFENMIEKILLEGEIAVPEMVAKKPSYHKIVYSKKRKLDSMLEVPDFKEKYIEKYGDLPMSTDYKPLK